jgi:hypothetical protein
MLSKLKNVYSMRFLPLGFAQMVILDQDFQRKYYDFTFVRREFLGEVRCVVIDVAPKKDAPRAASSAASGSKTRTTTSSASTALTILIRTATVITCTLTAGGRTCAPASGCLR